MTREGETGEGRGRRERGRQMQKQTQRHRAERDCHAAETRGLESGLLHPHPTGSLWSRTGSLTSLQVSVSSITLPTPLLEMATSWSASCDPTSFDHKALYNWPPSFDDPITQYLMCSWYSLHSFNRYLLSTYYVPSLWNVSTNRIFVCSSISE